MRICSHNLLAIQLQDQSQHTVRGRVLRSEVNGVMADLASLIVVSQVHVRRLVQGLRTAGIYGMAE